MTKVKFYKDCDTYIGFTVSGHAAPRSENLDIDLVCCGVSVISQTAILGMEEVLKLKPKYEINDGIINLTLKNLTSDDIERCQVLIETMHVGLISMAFTYGDYMKIEIEEV
ncbi:ribosomal-processing cysteine protease Prp [Clostridium sp. Marseille-QA1073]